METFYIVEDVPAVLFLKLELVVCFFSLFQRLFGGKQSKQAPVTTAESMKNSTVISNPHATLNQVAPLLESPDAGPEVSEGGGSGLLFSGGRTLGSGTGTLGSEPVSRTIGGVIPWQPHNSFATKNAVQGIINKGNQ